jgi:protein-S-isoprenylcysteine O-methyltransferase Ste14
MQLVEDRLDGRSLRRSIALPVIAVGVGLVSTGLLFLCPSRLFAQAAVTEWSSVAKTTNSACGDGFVVKVVEQTGTMELTFFIYGRKAFRENSFTSATVELAPDQKVKSTGPYALVRHPMYASAMIMLLGVPIALGSWLGVLALAVVSPALIWRLLDEEHFLGANLPGYASYRETVRYRLIPHVW